jgi:hypothetical protein
MNSLISRIVNVTDSYFTSLCPHVMKNIVIIIPENININLNVHKSTFPTYTCVCVCVCVCVYVCNTMIIYSNLRDRLWKYYN